jgi:hypothetical protein
MGVAEYQLVHALPAQLETSLPSIEQLETELQEPPHEDLREEPRAQPAAKGKRSTPKKRVR